MDNHDSHNQKAESLKEALNVLLAIPALLSSIEAINTKIDALQTEFESMRAEIRASQRAKIPQRKFYTVQEAAKTLGVCDESVRRAVKRRLLGRSNAFGRILIPAEDVERGFGRKTVLTQE